MSSRATRQILKTVSAWALIMLVLMTLPILWLLWETRSAAVPGVYHADGVWGSSTLTLRRDHTFTQEVKFVDEYAQRATESKVISGRWEEKGRHYFDQNIEITPFIGLFYWDPGKVYDSYDAAYGPVALSGLGIEINIADGTVYRK